MATTEMPRSGIDLWKHGVDSADARWDVYDKDIQETVNEYNRHLRSTPGYFPLDWRWIKGMTYVETGAKHPDWKTKPLQIGNPGDPGLRAFLGDREGGDLIRPPMLWLSPDAAVRSPRKNIQAGVGYLLMRLANFQYQSVVDRDGKVYEVTARAGDSLERIAKAQGSTVEVVKKLNPDAHFLRPGQVLKYQRASVQRVIVGWKSINAASIAHYYNGGGDPQYATKLGYAMDAIRAKAKGAQ